MQFIIILDFDFGEWHTHMRKQGNRKEYNLTPSNDDPLLN